MEPLAEETEGKEELPHHELDVVEVLVIELRVLELGFGRHLLQLVFQLALEQEIPSGVEQDRAYG